MLDLLGHDEELEHADAALVTRLAAPRAALPAIERCARERLRNVGREAVAQELVDRRVVHLAAVGAELPREALREDGGDGGAGQERLDTHLVQARDRARRI